MQNNCRWCSADFEIYPEDLAFYKKQGVTTVTLCPDCRQMRRSMFRNERNLYHRKCDLTGKQIISIYAPESPFKVYEQELWWSDKWNPLSYGRNFDFGKPFFDQYRELQLKVPRLALYQKNVQNSAYTNYTENIKNCYLCADTARSEDVCYSKWIIDCRDLVDCYQLERSERCYESLYAVDNYNCLYLYLSDRNRDSAFLYDCNDLSDCFMCWNLRKKRFCIENKQYDEVEYRKIRDAIKLGSYKIFELYKKRFLEVLKYEGIRRHQHIVMSEDCSGDLIYQCKNVKDSYEVINAQDLRYCYDAGYSKDCYDAYEQAFNCERQYECISCNRGQFLIGCAACYDTSNSFYCEMCHNSRDLFGCIGLKHKQYCILNKQYSREKYYQLLRKIIEHMKKAEEWGEFFPPQLSPFAYNETIAMEFFHLSKDEVKAKGFLWKEMNEENMYKGPDVLIPDNIADADFGLCDEILRCEVSNKPYKLTRLELELYKKFQVPMPRICPDQRHLSRMLLRNPRKLFERKCAKCGDAVRTTFPVDAPQKVYCQKCYLAVVY